MPGYNEYEDRRNEYKVRLMAKRVGLRLERQGQSEHFMLTDPDNERDQVVVGDLTLDDAECWLAEVIA